MDVLSTVLKYIFIAFVCFYVFHVNCYLRLIWDRSRGIQTKAEVLEYKGKSGAWFQWFYRKKKFHKYIVEYTDLEMDTKVQGEFLATEKNLAKGSLIDIKYVVDTDGELDIVQEECYKWIAIRFWIYTCLIHLLVLGGICMESGVFSGRGYYE